MPILVIFSRHEEGGDNITYPAIFPSTTSPLFKLLVSPKNPSGRTKIPHLPDPNCHVCDSFYVWPMYFYFNNITILYNEIASEKEKTVLYASPTSGYFDARKIGGFEGVECAFTPQRLSQQKNTKEPTSEMQK
eukprot:1445466-Ditylum_brightwellii.AAC.1